MAAPWPFVAGLASFLGLAALTLAAARSWLRARPQDGASLETAALAVAGFAGFVLLFQNVLVHDALWYYSYLRSAIVDGDLDLYEEFVLRNPNGMYLPPPGTPIFHLGTSLLALPLALVARPLALIFGRLGTLPGGDGYGPLEVGAVTVTSMLLALGGVALTHRLARSYSGGATSAVAQVALLYASPLAFFAFVWPGYPHPATVLLGAVFLLVWAASDREDATWRALLLGVLGGVLALVHPQDIVYLALPASDALAALVRGERRGVIRRCSLLLGGAVLGFSPQLAAWMATSGRPLPHVYAEIGDPFRWSHPALFDVLFSGYNGLLVWSPLCGVALLGLLGLRREHPRIFRGLALLVLLQWWAIASYGYWWGGASFGARYFLSAYPALGVGLALAFRWVGRKVGLIAVGVAAAAFVYWNLLLMAQFRLEWIPHNQPPDLATVLARQWEWAPGALFEGLGLPFRWNRVVMVEGLRAGLGSPTVGALVGWVVAALLGLLAVLGWVRWLGNGKPRPSCRAGALLVSGSVILSVFGVLSVAKGHERSRLQAETRELPARIRAGEVRVVSLSAPLEGPTAAEPTAVLLPGASREAGPRELRLDLVSFLHNAEMLQEGKIVAWVGIEGPGCGRMRHPMRAGFETAETAPDRLEVSREMRHGVDNATVIHSWWQDDDSSRPYWGHAYLASWPILGDCRPRSVALRVERGAADLEVRRLVLAGVREGS